MVSITSDALQANRKNGGENTAVYCVQENMPVMPCNPNGMRSENQDSILIRTLNSYYGAKMYRSNEKWNFDGCGTLRKEDCFTTSEKYHFNRQKARKLKRQQQESQMDISLRQNQTSSVDWLNLVSLKDMALKSAQPNEQKTSDEIVCSYAKNKRKKCGIKSLHDNRRTNNNALLRRLKGKGNVRTVSGGNVILEEIIYTDTTTINVNSYSGYEVLNITPNSPISAAQFSLTQYAGAVSISGLEILQNSGKEALIDLLEGRQKVAEAQLMNRMDYDMYQDGTGNSSKNITGLALAIPDDPTTGTYGGISRSSWAFWQSQYYRGVTDGGAAVSAANIQQYMTTLGLRCVRGSNKPDLWLADSTYYGFYVNSLQAIQRITNATGDGAAGAGFGPELKFYGGGFAADVVLGGGLNGDVNSAGTNGGATSAHMWAISESMTIH